MKRSRFPNPPRPRKGTPEPDLGAEPIRIVSTMDVTAETVERCEFCKCAATVWWRGHAVCTRCQTYDLARKF